MKPARIIWIAWCLVWVLVWSVLFLHDAASWGHCADTLGAAYCGSRRLAYGWLFLAALSGLAIALPVGAGSWREWWHRWSPARMVDEARRDDPLSDEWRRTR